MPAKKSKSIKDSAVMKLLMPEDLPADQWGISQAWIIDTAKAITPLVILYHIIAFNQWSNATAWVYFGTHGTDGLLWAGKTVFGFADQRWQSRKPLWANFQTALALMLYWAPIRIICQNATQAPAWLLGVSVMSFGLGVFFHFASDIHKTVFLEFRAQLKALDEKKAPTVLKDKMWAWSRNPNYFGELLIYSSFVILSMHWFPVVWLLAMISLIWYPSMLLKEESLSRFGKEYEQYQKSSAFFIPYLW